MKISVLLDTLIEIAQISKTDFAISMNMTPSGLSKILTGRRLPINKERKTFSSQAAHYLAEAIYDDDCYLKFKNIFPVIYDFDSKHELGVFLAYAIEYTLDKDFAEESNRDLDYPDTERSFLGKRMVLNVLCVTLSEYFRSSKEVPLEFYSAIPILNPVYYDILYRIKIIGERKKERNVINHLVSMSSFGESYMGSRMNILSALVGIEKSIDLKLWEAEEKIQSPFFFLKEQFLILFSVEIDGKTPLLTFITNKTYLSMFFNSLMKQDIKKISYTQNEAIEALQADPSTISKFLERRIDAAYNFVTIGYLIRGEELKDKECAEIVKSGILRLFEKVLTSDTTFFVTVDAMMEFYYTGKVIIPLVGAIDFPQGERVPYLRRFDDFMDKEDIGKVKVIDSKLPRVSLLCLEGLAIIYLIDGDYANQKIHFLRTDAIAEDMAGELSDNSFKLIEFNSELWNSYLAGLSV